MAGIPGDTERDLPTYCSRGADGRWEAIALVGRDVVRAGGTTEQAARDACAAAARSRLSPDTARRRRFDAARAAGRLFGYAAFAGTATAFAAEVLVGVDPSMLLRGPHLVVTVLAAAMLYAALYWWSLRSRPGTTTAAGWAIASTGLVVTFLAHAHLYVPVPDPDLPGPDAVLTVGPMLTRQLEWLPHALVRRQGAIEEGLLALREQGWAGPAAGGAAEAALRELQAELEVLVKWLAVLNDVLDRNEVGSVPVCATDVTRQVAAVADAARRFLRAAAPEAALLPQTAPPSPAPAGRTRAVPAGPEVRRVEGLARELGGGVHALEEGIRRLIRRSTPAATTTRTQ